jgi:hypothetical protein
MRGSAQRPKRFELPCWKVNCKRMEDSKLDHGNPILGIDVDARCSRSMKTGTILGREDFELSGRHGPRCSSTPTGITVGYIFVWILVYGGINCLNKHSVPKIRGILQFRLYRLDKSSIRCTNDSSISDTDSPAILVLHIHRRTHPNKVQSKIAELTHRLKEATTR